MMETESLIKKNKKLHHSPFLAKNNDNIQNKGIWNANEHLNKEIKKSGKELPP